MSDQVSREFFNFAHLPPKLQTISEPFHQVMCTMDDEIIDSPEKEAGMRKLLEAKDCFVRAKLQQSTPKSEY